MTRTGTARWQGNPSMTDVRFGRAILNITTKTGSDHYLVQTTKGGHVLTKVGGDEKRYTVRGDFCTCPDSALAKNHCKHARALNAALAKL